MRCDRFTGLIAAQRSLARSPSTWLRVACEHEITDQPVLRLSPPATARHERAGITEQKNSFLCVLCVLCER